MLLDSRARWVPERVTGANHSSRVAPHAVGIRLIRTQLNQRRIKAEVSRPEKRKHVAVRLRLMRMGKKKQPTYRVVAADARSPRDGRFIEIVGTYNPRTEPSDIKIDNAKAVRWLRNGAQPTERVVKLLKVSGAWEAFESGTSVEDLEAAAAAAAAEAAAKAEAETTAAAGAEA